MHDWVHQVNFDKWKKITIDCSLLFLLEVKVLGTLYLKYKSHFFEAEPKLIHRMSKAHENQFLQGWCFRERSPEHQRCETTLLLIEALAAFSLSLDNSISIFAWIFSQSTSTWRDRKTKWNEIRYHIDQYEIHSTKQLNSMVRKGSHRTPEKCGAFEFFSPLFTLKRFFCRKRHNSNAPGGQQQLLGFPPFLV